VNDLRPIKKPIILAFVGMPGGGKTEAVAYLEKKGIPFVRFGQITDEEVKRLGLPLTPANERMVRERIRKEEGMGAYALRAEPNISSLVSTHNVVAIDGLYSWEEYRFLKERFPGLVLIHIFAEPKIRYERLSKRTIRSLTLEESLMRDLMELEKLNKGGPIAIADYLIENNGDSIEDLYLKIDNLLLRLSVGSSS